MRALASIVRMDARAGRLSIQRCFAVANDTAVTSGRRSCSWRKEEDDPCPAQEFAAAEPPHLQHVQQRPSDRAGARAQAFRRRPRFLLPRSISPKSHSHLSFSPRQFSISMFTARLLPRRSPKQRDWARSNCGVHGLLPCQRPAQPCFPSRSGNRLSKRRTIAAPVGPSPAPRRSKLRIAASSIF